MNELSAARRRWSNLSELPTVHVSSGLSIWPGFEFQEIEIPYYGTFANTSPRVAVVHTSGPIRVRHGGARKPFKDLPTYPTLTPPGDGSFGAWKGAQRGRHLFIEPGAFERTTHQPFRHGALRLLEGPNPAIEQLLRVLQADIITGHPSGSTLGEAIISSILHQIICQSGLIFAAPTGRTGHLSQGELRRICQLIRQFSNVRKTGSFHRL
jgi:hypothetical protein